MAFTVSDKLVRERYGAEFDLSKWVEGVDYVRRKAFKGERVVFRKGFLDSEPCVVKCDPGVEEVIQSKVDFGGSGVYECKVTKMFPNQRYVGTDKGVVYVGKKPVKRGQILIAGDGIMIGTSKPR